MSSEVNPAPRRFIVGRPSWTHYSIPISHVAERAVAGPEQTGVLPEVAA
ncbi:hypothetical protein [Paraburkholderia sediminicola]